MKDLTDVNIYCINLDDRQDRLELFNSQAALVAMPPIKRISGVEGQKVDTVNNQQIGLQTRVQLTTSYRRSHYEIHSKGAIGASLSHYKTWKEFIKSGAKYALIMEDDAELPPTFALMFNHTIKNLPVSWDLWILGWNHSPIDLNEKDREPFRQILHFIGAHCYLITRKTAKLFIKEMFPIETHIEHFMSNVAYMNNLRIVRNIGFHVAQIDRTRNVSDVRKPEGCPTCLVDDNVQANDARRKNMANLNVSLK
jgi:GR25 family glycosyltransferase involved in LPS biosynthesis